MLITAANLKTMFTGFNTAFNKGLGTATTFHGTVAMEVPSTTKENTYGWLGQFPKLREWVGDRVVNSLAAHGYTVVNRDFETTITVPRNAGEDDQYGIFGPVFTELGKSTAEHPDELIFSLLAQGFTGQGYDGRPFFAADHPLKPFTSDASVVSNVQAGDGPAWFLLDCSRVIKPLIFQPRTAYTLTAFTKESDEHVFWHKEYVYGVQGRSNAGFGLWQLAFASKAPLTAENYEAARKAMQELRGESGRPLGIKPDTLVVAPALEGDAMRLLNNGDRVVMVDTGSGSVPVSITNEWAGTAKPIISHWLAA